MANQSAMQSPLVHNSGNMPDKNPHAATAYDLLGDIAVTLSIELGRQQLTIHDLMKLDYGRVIDLATKQDDLLAIHVNGKPFAKGELVRVGSQFGVKIVEIASVDKNDSGKPCND
jgi:flagellar motor switch protein FliN